MNGLMVFLLNYLMVPKIGPGEYKVHNDPEQVKRFDTGFYYNGNYDLNNGIRFRLWTRNNPYYAQEILVWNRNSLYSSNFDRARLTKIFLHGANHRATERWLDKETAYMRDAFVTFADVNFILMDWTALASHLNYVTNNGDIAATRLAQFIQFLNNNGVPLESIHLIGHSWGAHVAGMVGKKFGGRLPRITGLDPAGPFYTRPWIYPERRLNKTDAKFVDVLHLDGGPFFVGRNAHVGLVEPLGHIDFYPNGGSDQPSCPPKTTATAKDYYCSHERGIFYFAESIGSPFAFPSCKCESWDRFSRNQCECTGEEMTFMGEHCSKSKSGSFFLSVAPTTPYGLGPQTDVILKSITKAPTFVQTETRAGGGKRGRAQAQQPNQIVLNMPNYSSKFIARYKEDVVKALLSKLANYRVDS